MTRLCILGSTGSVGAQALEVARSLGLEIVGLSAWSSVDLLVEQAREFSPRAVAVGDSRCAERARAALSTLSPSPELLIGRDGIAELAAYAEQDLVLNAIVGFEGVYPTLAACAAGHDVALANKETLVAAGQLVMKAAQDAGCTIRPVDSEHSAIWQCLSGQDRSAVSRIILTASGGPFRDRTDLSEVTRAEAVSHPNWAMGPKISVDSATMMNKALEVIEAHWLFGVDPDRIDVLIHRESVVHSMVEFIDGSTIAQLGAADMRVPIQFAITYPKRRRGLSRGLDLASMGTLSFAHPDLNRFPAAGLGHAALLRGGACPAVMSAANEEAVRLFLAGRIRFTEITPAVIAAMNAFDDTGFDSIDAIARADAWARDYVRGRCRL